MPSRIFNIIPFLLITLAVVVGVELFYLAVERYLLTPATVVQSVGEEQQQEATPTDRGSTRRANYAIITERNLFGPPPQASPLTNRPPQRPPEELETTKLEIVLMGTIDGNEEDSRAIILRKKDRQQDLYKVGDELLGARIKQILRGKVVLNRNGADEMLDLSEAAKFAPKAAPRPVSARPVTRQARTIGSVGEGPGVNEQTPKPRRRIVRPTRRIVRTPVIEIPPAEIDDSEAIDEQQLEEELDLPDEEELLENEN